ncbi:MAG: DsbA family protein [Pseudomonadota bacterium]|nr:DsbA family protein [Pseudomonadota bacterium]MEC8797282.1 DsbA family protein [Pseudomonadota bacterium]
MSSLKNKIKKNLPFLSILLIVLNLVFFFSTNYKTSIDEDKIVKIFSEDKSILPRILDKLEIIEEQNNIKNIVLYYKDLVKNDNLFLGNKNGKEIIIEFFDYNCGYCKRSFPEIMELVSENKDIKIILKELPVLGESSILASKASIASQKQDKYFEFHQELINFSGLISLIDIKKISKELGINYEQLQKDMNSEETILLINESYRLADLIGVRGTPAFIINNNLIPGAIGKNEMLRFLNK